MTPADAVNLWNIAAERCDWPKVRDLTASRVRSLKQRLKNGGDDFREALAKAEASGFLNGSRPRSANHSNWVLTFDTLIRESFFMRLLEGVYDDREAKAAKPLSDDELRWRARLEGFRRSQFWLRASWGPAPGEPGCLCPAAFLTH
jgi:hypothetical protein